MCKKILKSDEGGNFLINGGVTPLDMRFKNDLFS